MSATSSVSPEQAQRIETIIEAYLTEDQFTIHTHDDHINIQCNGLPGNLAEVLYQLAKHGYSFNLDNVFEAPPKIQITGISHDPGATPPTADEVNLPETAGIQYSETAHTERLEYRDVELSFDLPQNPERTTKITVVETASVFSDKIADALDQCPIPVADVTEFAQDGFIFTTDATDLESREELGVVLKTLVEGAWSDPGACWLFTHVTESPSCSHLIFIVDV
jgi:hypothetical protein